MKVGILHLSDIHIEDNDDWIIDKGEKIAQAVKGTWEKFDTIFIVVSGDIANKGSLDQYKLANTFLAGIKTYLQKEATSQVFFVVSPGNHDCDLSEENKDLKARKAFIDTILRDYSDVEKGDSIYKGCLSVQENFFKFLNNLEPQVDYPAEPEVFYQVSISLENHTFYFNIFNTAWLSQIHETQGKLVFPPQLINLDPEKLSQGAFSVSIFHHPENWLDSNNANEIRRITEQNSDIIISGHEHYGDVFYKRQPESEVQTQVIKADALQERSRPESSSFNLIIVDLQQKKQKLFSFRWKDVEYKVKKENDWEEFVRNRFLQSQSFYLLPDFQNYLNSLGALAWHSRKRAVYLEDFFIAPRLLITSLKEVILGKRETKKIEAEQFFDTIFESKKLIIFGDTWQGKTTIAKKVFKELYEHQYATLLVDGSKFDSPSEEHFRKVLSGEFEKQYSGNLWNRFRQLPTEKRALIIDNFGQSNLNQSSLQKILCLANDFFELVVVFAHTDLSLQQYMLADNNEPRLSNYTHCQMLPLNKTQRTQLIRRYTRFESDPSVEERELIRREHQLGNIIQEAINSGLIASTPFFVLGALQLIESYKSDPNAQFGSIGYIYEGIITGKWSELGKNPTQIDQAFLVTSIIAHWLYANDTNEIEQDNVDTLIKKYNHDYREDININKFLKDLQTAQILIKQDNGRWKFAGTHMRDFFVARYYAHTLGEEDSPEKTQAQEDVQSMIETIIYEPHTRILLFLVYEANSNKRLIRWILDEASLVYANFNVADFEKDVQFINDLEQSVLDKNLLKSADPRENQDTQDNLLSINEDNDSDLPVRRSSRVTKYSDDLDDFTKTSFALKMIELVGQLVKSFAGTIRAQLKQELVEECIDIGLRLLRAVFESHRHNLQEVVKIFKYLVRQQNPDLSLQEVEHKADELLIVIHHGIAYAVIKKISSSVGHEDLKDIFNDIFQSKEALSYKLVETAIRLDHYESPLADRVIRFSRQIKNNEFAHNVLKRLVADYINYFGVRGSERQRLVDELKLLGGKGYLINTDKGERAVHVSDGKSQPFSPPEKGKKPKKNRKNSY
jgi:UDP-2,3-diacylglucosamine pyrophosphatase LpxH